LIASAELGDLAVALAAAQSQILAAKEDSTNAHLRSGYASLSSCWAACRGPLTANGLAVVQGLTCDGEALTCSTRLIHSSGQWVEASLSLPVDHRKGLTIAQSVGSVGTYARRYGLCALVGIAPGDDDDGAGAPTAPKPKPKPKPPRWTKTAQGRFFARLRDEVPWLGEHHGSDAYDRIVAPLCESIGRPRPSAMTDSQRDGLIAWLISDAGRAAVAEYAAAL